MRSGIPALLLIVMGCLIGCGASPISNGVEYSPPPAKATSQNLPQTLDTGDDNSIPFDELAKKLDLPLPEDFPVSKGEVFSGKPAKPILADKRARNYRTAITEGVSRGPNFAGRYTVVSWGAGMGNFSMVVVDARSGRIYFPPFESVSRAGYFQLGADEPPSFRLDSRLFVFMGCPGKEYEGCSNWDREGFYIYRFDDGRFKLLRFVKRDEFEAASNK